MVDDFFEKTCSASFFLEIEIGQNYFDTISIPTESSGKVPAFIPVVFRLDWLS
jgi:hypothetical protein